MIINLRFNSRETSSCLFLTFSFMEVVPMVISLGFPPKMIILFLLEISIPNLDNLSYMLCFYKMTEYFPRKISLKVYLTLLLQNCNKNGTVCTEFLFSKRS